MDPQVLVIDDDLHQLIMLQQGLELHGFRVTTAAEGREGLRRAYQTHPDAIVLDVRMDGMDGWTACERLRQVTDVPLIMLSANTNQKDVIKGLSLGADDYVTKPYDLRELVSRIHSHLRRHSRRAPSDGQSIYDDGRLYVDLRDGKALKDGDLVQLTPIETRLLVRLVQEMGRIVPHRKLLNDVWGPGYGNAVDQLNVSIHTLRRKIEDNPSRPRYVRTRWKLGYYFTGVQAVV